MKSKSFTKKLFLNKKTIVHLDNGGMKELQGGASQTDCIFSDDDVSCYVISCNPNRCNDPGMFTNDDVSCPQVTCCV